MPFILNIDDLDAGVNARFQEVLSRSYVLGPKTYLFESRDTPTREDALFQQIELFAELATAAEKSEVTFWLVSRMPVTDDVRMTYLPEI